MPSPFLVMKHLCAWSSGSGNLLHCSKDIKGSLGSTTFLLWEQSFIKAYKVLLYYNTSSIIKPKSLKNQFANKTLSSVCCSAMTPMEQHFLYYFVIPLFHKPPSMILNFIKVEFLHYFNFNKCKKVSICLSLKLYIYMKIEKKTKKEQNIKIYKALKCHTLNLFLELENILQFMLIGLQTFL